MDFKRDYWHDDYLEELVENYRKNRDPEPLTNLIHSDVDAMSAPAIGRLFLDMINGELPKIVNRPNSTAGTRKKSIELVQFYLGMNYKKTRVFMEVGEKLFKSTDTIKGYVNDWLEGIIQIDFSYECIDKSDFWKSPEKYLGNTAAFNDGRLMIDDQLAKKEMKLSSMQDITSFRGEIEKQYTNIETVKPQDPWETISEKLLTERALDVLNDKSRE